MLARLSSLLTSISLLLLACAATAQVQAIPVDPAPPAAAASAPAPQTQAPARHDQPAPKSKLPAKSDINRIGERGIGHGIDVYSLPKERAMGDALSTNIDQHTKLITDPDVIDYVNRLAQKIGRNSDTEFLITVKIIDTDDINIFSLPGGFIYVDKGLITSLESEAQLAGLMAHEIAHVAARHATHALTRQYAWQTISLPLLYLGPIAFPVEYLVLPLTNRKFDRNAEREADLLGMQYTYVAGYDPEAFVEALEKLNGLEARQRKAYARIPLYKQLVRLPFHGPLSHAASRRPDMESRIRALQKEIATLLPEENEYVVDTNEFQDVQDRLNWINRPMFKHHGEAEDPAKKDLPRLRDMIPLPQPAHAAFQ